jgi:5'-3' exonuclease
MIKYIRYKIPYTEINQELNSKNYKQIVFFLDLNSIARGFYNRDVIRTEFGYYIEDKKLPFLLINELKDFLNNLYNSYKKYNPTFCIFYDIGMNLQNKNVSGTYKANRTNESKSYIETDEERELYYHIKNYYFEEIYKQFNKKGVSKVVFLKDYESDFVPYYFIKKYEFCNNQSTINIILSVDKDLLQCCQLGNTFQATSIYLKNQSKIESILYNDNNAVCFLSKKFNPDGKITSKYIPLLLAIAGDKSDNIPGIKRGIGIVKAIELVRDYGIAADFNSSYILPLLIQSEKLKLQTNLSLISFERQISRIPKDVLDSI